MFAPGTTNIEPPTNVLTTYAPPLLKSSSEVRAASKALLSPSSSPGCAPIVNQLSNSRFGNDAKNNGFIFPPKSDPTASL